MFPCLIPIMFLASGIPLESGSPVDVPCRSGDDVLQYDDGYVSFLTWAGNYRGVWFDLDDFYPGASGFSIDTLEVWVYSGSYVAAIYTGGPEGPGSCLYESELTSGSVVPVDPPVEVEGSDFWVIMTPESPGGTPLLGDATPQPVASHSFFSDDFVVWEPWMMGGPNASDYFIRTHGSPLEELAPSTWGAIKTRI